MPVAQLDRASDSDSEGRTFKSCRARQAKHPPLRWVFCLMRFGSANLNVVHLGGEAACSASIPCFLFQSDAVSCRARHVAASSTWLATTFLLHKQVIAAPCSAASPFRKRSRLIFLFGCKRPHNEKSSLPTLCGRTLAVGVLLDALRERKFERSALRRRSRMLGIDSLFFVPKRCRIVSGTLKSLENTLFSGLFRYVSFPALDSVSDDDAEEQEQKHKREVCNEKRRAFFDPFEVVDLDH